LVETARDYARAAASNNTLKAYAKDWSHFGRWYRMRGTDPLPPSPELVGLHIADLAAPQSKAPALSSTPPLSVASIERRLSGLVWGYAQRGERLVNRHAKLTPYRRPKLTPLAASRSGPEPTDHRVEAGQALFTKRTPKAA
jgi:hypothetical protein